MQRADRRFRDEVVSSGVEARRNRLNAISKRVLDAAIAIHRAFGPGLLESAYAKALLIELRHQGLGVQSEVTIETSWRGDPLGAAFRADLIVEGCLLVELKPVSELSPLFKAQVRTYLKLLEFRLGPLINFNHERLIDGFERIPNQF